MGNERWVREALVGREIAAPGGGRAVIADFGRHGALLLRRDTGERFALDMRAIAATIRRWGLLRRAPRPDELDTPDLTPEQAAFLIPLIAAIRATPDVRGWLDERGQPQAGVH